MGADAIVQAVARRHRQRRQLRLLPRMVLLVAAAGAIGHWLDSYLLGSLIGIAVLAIGIIVLRRSSALQPDQLVAALDDIVPELEDSTSLLLRPPRSRLEHAQAQRIEQRLTQLHAVQDLAALLPSPRLRWLDTMVIIVGLGAVASGLFALLHPPRFEVQVVPPAYTGLAPYTTDALDLEIPQGSTVTWSADEPLAGAVWVGDRVESPFIGRRVEQRIDQDTLYRLEWGPPQDRQATAPARVRVVRDRPPELTLVQPDSSPVEFETVDTRLAIAFTASDDHGLGPAELLVTVASGEGEGVRFRDRSLPLVPNGNQRSARYTHPLDPVALEMAPGDELYVRAVVSDNRNPDAQQTRSPAVVFRWRNPEEATEMVMGMPVDRLPEYFRSQRQIIIDTEQLLADAPDLPAATIRERSEALAFDQRSLRFRYGQYLGEEVATDGGETAADHDHEDGAEPEEENLLETFGHTHDTAENATLFDDNTRATLKGALNAMWQAELQLALSEPEAALPHEYEALDQLKAVQHAARIYVKRVGFEPPPLSEERRLSGDYDEAQSTVRPPPEAPASDAQPGPLLSSLVAAGDLDAPTAARLRALSADLELPLALRAEAASLADQPECRECRTRLIGLLLEQAEPPPMRPQRPHYDGGKALRIDP